MAYEFTYRLTDIAQEDFDHLIGYMVEKLCNLQAATVFADDIEEALENLCEFPLEGPLVDNPYLSVKNVRMLVVRQYNIYYLADEEEKIITVIRIGHSLQDQEKLLGESSIINYRE